MVNWDKPERFILAMGGIPQVAQRLKLWQLKHNCADRCPTDSALRVASYAIF